MAKQTSRELALERRKALSESGKKTTSMSGAGESRVRTSADARQTRTQTSFVKPKNQSLKPVSESRQVSNSNASGAIRSIKSVSHPSRELVLARREALSRRGKSADTSKDRTRVEVERHSSNTQSQSPKAADSKSTPLATESSDTSIASSPIRAPKLNSKKGDRRNISKRRAIQNTSRALVLARREAQSKHGKSAGKQPTSAASVARQGDPDLTSRELAQRVRELRSKSGETGKKRSAICRPCGPNKNGSKQEALAGADAHWKVGMSETSTGQV